VSQLVIEQLDRAFELEVKRFHLSAKIRSTCPYCGYVDERDYSESDYLSYPVANEPFNITFEHELEEGLDDANATRWKTHEWTERVVLKVSLEPSTEAA